MHIWAQNKFTVWFNFGRFRAMERIPGLKQPWSAIFTSTPNLATFVIGQGGSGGSCYGIAMAADGSVVVVGRTYGDWDGINAGDADFAAFRLDASGEGIWRFQVNIFLQCSAVFPNWLCDCAYGRQL